MKSEGRQLTKHILETQDSMIIIMKCLFLHLDVIGRLS